MKNYKKFYGLIATIIMVLSMLNITIYASTDSRNETLTYKNLVGDTRYDTSILVSQEAYPNRAENIILVNGTRNTDGVLAEVLAYKLSAPVLLTTKDKLSDDLKEEIKRLNPKKAYIIGGTSVISKSIINELKNMNVSTERIYGSTRYTTAIAVAEKVGNFNKVIICNSKDNGANASAVVAVAAKNGIPILYNDSNSGINSATYNFIKSNRKQIKTIYIVGNRMSTSQQKYLKKYGITVKRTNVENPYDINVAMLKEFCKNIQYNNVVLVNNPIDAVSVSYLAAKNNSLFLYTGTNLTEAQKRIVEKYQISKIYYSSGGKIKGPIKEVINILENNTTSDTELNLNKSKVVFYVPHQDDESSYFSQAILKAIKERGAENVYVVMLTDGAASGIAKKTEVQKILKQKGISFSQARDNEFLAACNALGLKESNILFNEDLGLSRLKDQEVVSDDVKATMLYFENKFDGDVTHITYSFKFEYHNDHQQMGKALNELYYDLSLPEDSFSSVYFIIRSNYQFKERGTNDIKMFTLKEINYGYRIINALNMYKETYDSIDKTKIRIGIGYRSARNVIDGVIENVRNKTLITNIHLPY